MSTYRAHGVCPDVRPTSCGSECMSDIADGPLREIAVMADLFHVKQLGWHRNPPAGEESRKRVSGTGLARKSD